MNNILGQIPHISEGDWHSFTPRFWLYTDSTTPDTKFYQHLMTILHGIDIVLASYESMLNVTDLDYMQKY